MGDAAAGGMLALGRLPRAEMPALYAAADCVAHPVVDQWPHAINEAIAAGVPVVASPDTGVPAEMVTGPGCAIVEPIAAALSPALREALDVSRRSSPELREAIRQPLEPWSVPRMAERVVAAARSARPR